MELRDFLPGMIGAFVGVTGWLLALGGPPIFLQHSLAALLAPIARLRRYRGEYEEYLRRGPSEIVELEPLPA